MGCFNVWQQINHAMVKMTDYMVVKLMTYIVDYDNEDTLIVTLTDVSFVILNVVNKQVIREANSYGCLIMVFLTVQG